MNRYPVSVYFDTHRNTVVRLALCELDNGRQLAVRDAVVPGRVVTQLTMDHERADLELRASLVVGYKVGRLLATSERNPPGA